MRPMRILAASALLLSTACFHFKYVNPDAQPAPAVQDEAWHNGFFWGIVEHSPQVPVAQICPGGYAVVASEESFLNGLLQGVTWGLYAPQTVSVTCSASGNAPQSPNRPWGQ